MKPELWDTSSWGSVSHGCRGEQDVLSSLGPHPGLGFGAAVKYKIPTSPSVARLGQGNTGQVPTSLLKISLCAWTVSFLYIYASMQCLCMGEQHTHVFISHVCDR